MEVSFAFLCDYADQAGKLTAVGIGIDTIYAKQVPAVNPLFFAVIALRFSRVEVGSKRVRVHLQDADGGDVVPPLNTVITIQEPPATYTHRTQRVNLGFHGVQFPRYGDYEISWVVDDNLVATIPLKVAPPPTGQAAPHS